jgi:hypothetical protein
MFEVDRILAERTLAELPLTAATRRFADWWLSQIGEDGRPVPSAVATPLPDDLAAEVIVCEVRPWSTVLCRMAGEKITRAVGANLAGRDLLAFAVPAHRAIRLKRNVDALQGILLLGYRALTTTGGTELRMQELHVPHPDRVALPVERGAGMTMTYRDTGVLIENMQVLVSRGALDVLNEPLSIDLRKRFAAAS